MNELSEFTSTYAAWQQGVTPEDGGWNDQPYVWTAAVHDLDARVERIRTWMQERANHGHRQ